MSADTRMSLERLLGIKLPIIQAPMAGAQDSALTIAVANAGGLGSLPCAMLSPEKMRSELASIRSQCGSRPINVNFFCHQEPIPNESKERSWRKKLESYYRELGLPVDATINGAQRRPFNHEAAEALAEFKPEVVSFHFGLPAPELVERVRSWGAKIFSSATTLEEARWLEERGVDLIIAQGWEAGGHRGHFLSQDLSGHLETSALVEQIVKTARVPVVAAGGIADAKGVATALELGAVGAQIGTAYLLCRESRISPVFRAALKSEAAQNTEVTNVITGRAARGIVNRIIRELGPIDPEAPEFPLAYNAVAPLRAKAESLGRGDFSALWAGKNVSGCKETGAAELTRELAALV